MGFQCACWRKPLTRSHRPWPCYSTNPCGSSFLQETGNSQILYPFSRKGRETLSRIIALFPFSLSSPNFSSASFLRVYGIIYLHLISREQHGFLAGRSCVTQLTSVLHYIGSQLDAGKQIDIIYLAVSKAFNKVDHIELLERLHQYGITGKLHGWFRSYLQGCKQQGTVLGATSRELPVTSRIPQGSLLGPILFVDDLNQTLLRLRELLVTRMIPCLVPVRRFPSPYQSIHFGDVSEADRRETPRQKQNAHACVAFWNSKMPLML